MTDTSQSTRINRRSAMKIGGGTIVGIAGLGGIAYLFGDSAAAAEITSFTFTDDNIEVHTADGLVEEIEVTVNNYTIDYWNITDEDAEFRTTIETTAENSGGFIVAGPDAVTGEFHPWDDAIPETPEGTINDTSLEVDEGSLLLIENGPYETGTSEDPETGTFFTDDGTDETFTIEMEVTVEGIVDSVDHIDFSDAETFDMTVYNEGEYLEVTIEMTPDATAVNEPHDPEE